MGSWWGWRSGDSASLPPMWLRFDSGPVGTVCVVECVVSSRLCSEGFPPGSLVLLHQLEVNNQKSKITRRSKFFKADVLSIIILFSAQCYLQQHLTEHGGSVAEWSACRTRNPAVLGSSPALATAWICFSVAPSSNPRPRL